MPTYTITAPDGNTYSIEGPDGATQQDVIQHVLAQHPDAAKEAKKPDPSKTSNKAGSTQATVLSPQGNSVSSRNKSYSPEIGAFITATLALIISIVLIAIFYKRFSRNLNSKLQKIFFYIILIILGNGLVKIFNELLGPPILGLSIRKDEILKPALTLIIIPIYLFISWVLNLKTSIDSSGSSVITFHDSHQVKSSQTNMTSSENNGLDPFLKICIAALVVIWFVTSSHMPKFDFTEASSVAQGLFKEKNQFKDIDSCFEHVLKTAVTEEKRWAGSSACQLSFLDDHPPTSSTYYGYCIMKNYHKILDDSSGTAVASECAKATNDVYLGSVFAKEFNSALRMQKIMEENRLDQHIRDLEQAVLIKELQYKDRQRTQEIEELKQRETNRVIDEPFPWSDNFPLLRRRLN